MLDRVDQKTHARKYITVNTGVADFDCFLHHLLRSWGFTICEPDNVDALLLAGDGIEPNNASQPLIRLTTSHYHGRDRLSLPLQIEQLWQTLENTFHRPPRMHIRMAVELPARVMIRNQRYETTISSLSDMGGRFHYPDEMVRDERVVLQFEIPGIQSRYDGCVIFSAPCTQADGGGYRIGVVFHGLKRSLRDELRNYLIQRYLEEIRPQMSETAFQAGLDHIELPASLLQAFKA